MEPISVAVIAALIAGSSAGVSEVTKCALTDAYSGLKNVLIDKFGSNSTTAEALEKLENNPNSFGWKEDLATDLSARNADRDTDIMVAVVKLIEVLEPTDQLPAIAQKVIGDGNALASHNSNATVNITITKYRE